MSPKSQLSRDYQVAELTRGVQLPLPTIQRRHVIVIAEVLKQAWQDLLKTQKQIMTEEEEKEINALMESRLNKIRIERRDWSTLVSGVSRGKESISFDGSSLEKRPDLSIHLTRGYFPLPLIVECKLIDTMTGKKVDLYCDNGLARFIDGEYAWYAQEAFMIAYVRDNSSIETCLVPHLEKNQKKLPDPFLTAQLPKPVSSSVKDFSRSFHSRRFPENPGPIVIWHLWIA